MTIDRTSEFEAQRTHLFGLAYRLLGRAEEAEDVVQDAFLRWAGADQGAIAVLPAWLAKVVTNLCLNRLVSARAQREQYVGLSLPEPVLTSDGALGPLDTVLLRESVSMALMAMLERLTPAERAVFVLREAFDYNYRDIAEILELSEANCRQVHRRARRHLDEARPRFHTEPARSRALAERFLAAAEQGDLRGLEQMLAADVSYSADGGGRVPAPKRPVVGSGRVAHLFATVARKFGTFSQVSLAEVNAQPAILGWSGDALFGVVVLEIADGRITALRAVSNPDKLHYVARQAGEVSRKSPLSGHRR